MKEKKNLIQISSLPKIQLPSGTTNLRSRYFSIGLIYLVCDKSCDGQSRVRLSAEARHFSLQNVPTGSGAHLAFYSIAAGSYFSAGNVGRAES